MVFGHIGLQNTNTEHEYYFSYQLSLLFSAKKGGEFAGSPQISASSGHPEFTALPRGFIPQEITGSVNFLPPGFVDYRSLGTVPQLPPGPIPYLHGQGDRRF